MNEHAQKLLDDYNDKAHPDWRERLAKRPAEIPSPGADPLAAASRMDVARQADELRGLVREAISFAAILSQGEEHCSVCKRTEDWMRRAREAL
jgi:hypothetical protein